MNLHQQVEVSLLTVIYSIRYGMPRLTYAAYDAVDLATEFWDLFDRSTREQLIDDWRFYLKTSANTLPPDAELARRWGVLAKRLEERDE